MEQLIKVQKTNVQATRNDDVLSDIARWFSGIAVKNFIKNGFCTDDEIIELMKLREKAIKYLNLKFDREIESLENNNNHNP